MNNNVPVLSESDFGHLCVRAHSGRLCWLEIKKWCIYSSLTALTETFYRTGKLWMALNFILLTSGFLKKTPFWFYSCQWCCISVSIMANCSSLASVWNEEIKQPQESKFDLEILWSKIVVLISRQLLLLSVREEVNRLWCSLVFTSLSIPLLPLPQFFFLHMDGVISLVGLHFQHELRFLGRGTIVARQFEPLWRRVCLAVLVPEALHPFLVRFESNWTGIMERRTQFLSTGRLPDYSSHTHKGEWKAFQTVHLEGSVKCSAGLLLRAVKCDDYTCECIWVVVVFSSLF